MALSKSQLAAELGGTGLGPSYSDEQCSYRDCGDRSRRDRRREDFVLPDVVKVGWGYISPRKKGEMYKKGETYVGFGGVEQVAEADSKPRKAKVKLEAKPAAPLNAMAPSPYRRGCTSLLPQDEGRQVHRQAEDSGIDNRGRVSTGWPAPPTRREHKCSTLEGRRG
jgi:hypothetical protein